MRGASLSLLLFVAAPLHAQDGAIPLPEHPRPDLERAEWVNLNGDWAFRFDKDGKGEGERWFESAPAAFPRTIHVPFPWGSKLSAGPDEADVAGRRLPRRRPANGADVRRARRPADRRLSGRLHAVRAGADEGGEARPGPEARAARGRHAARVQARRQAGVRQGARPLADGVPRGALRGLRGLVRGPPEPRGEARRAAAGAQGSGARGGGGASTR